jgi:hypothetical protein
MEKELAAERSAEMTAAQLIDQCWSEHAAIQE